MSLTDLHLLRPWWLLALLVVPMLPSLLRRVQARGNPWVRIVDASLLAAQSERTGGRQSVVPLLLTGWCIAVLALAGPAFRQLPQALEQREAPLVIALSLAPGMQADDIKPNRLERAKFKIADLLRSRRDGQFALLAYAQDAYTVAPITDDGNTLLALLDALDINVMPHVGDRADRAIVQAVKLLQDAGFERGDILLLTGSANRKAVAAAGKAIGKGFRVSLIGVGTDTPGPVPLAGGGFLQDEAGNILLPKLDEAALAAVADAGAGRYQRLRSGDGDLRALGLLDVSATGSVRQRIDADEGRMPDERLVYQDDGPWLLLLLLPLAAFGFRRGWLAAVALVALVPTTPVSAQSWSSLWQRADQRAWQALQDGDAEKARELARDPELAASAAYRQGDYASAAEGFSGDSADAHYNRGNALAQQGELQSALDEYQRALAIDPKMEDAAANQQIVQQALQQKKQEEQQSGNEGESTDSDKDAEKKHGESEQGEQQQKGQEDGEQGDKEGEKSAGDEQPGDDSEQNPDGDPADGQSQQGEPDEADENDAAAPAKPEDADAEQSFQQSMEQALADGEKSDAEQRVEMTAEQRDAQEQKQAVEQWLRRIPDDPGGLLRQKFRIEYQRRKQERQGDSE